MNFEQTKKLLLKNLKLRKPARRLMLPGGWQEVDWLWRLMRRNESDRSIELHANSYSLKLNTDHVKEFLSNNKEDFDGFLILKVIVLINTDTISLEPDL